MSSHSAKILALETANEQCSVALSHGQEIVFFQENFEPRMQTQLILPMIEQALAHAHWTWKDLDAIAFSRGPGAFSGVRINAAVAQALAWANDLPVLPISTLQAIAQKAYQKLANEQISAVIDARMNEVYFANYQLQDGIMHLQGEEQLLSYVDAQQSALSICVGSGANLLQNTENSMIVDASIHADAIAISQLAQYDWQHNKAVPAEQALPVYLRDNAWKKIAEQKA
ncbi:MULTISPECIES: tRNA (adenosine(37)-N6)-threonylcarbamoyltransferase complex dimerization subunit type 1 TsaB [unclassified Acinetobacter]|uniref:tRNA (adenosine(37)-N6)-threonylcarbamoyltransferase complex dimerization subunit type 1 TsaB n=1 Tax=unclassified Acinetobacter TaxID=196816 RepID=UPI0035BA9876